MHVEFTQAIYMLQIKSLDDEKKKQPGEGQLGLHMALALAAGHESVLLGFLASPKQVATCTCSYRQVALPPPTLSAAKSFPRTQRQRQELYNDKAGSYVPRHSQPANQR